MTLQIEAIEILMHCNNRCVYCARDAYPGNKGEYYTLEKFEEKISELREKGANGIELTGGEPTEHPDLIEMVKLCHKHNFEHVTINTNARNLKDMDFCKRLVKEGVDMFLTSIDGPNAEIHEAQTAIPGSFEETVAGFSNLSKLGAIISPLTVITRLNYKSIKEVFRMLHDRFNIPSAAISVSYPTGRGMVNFDQFAPSYADLKPYLKEALDYARSVGLKIDCDNIPLCYLLGHEYSYHPFYISGGVYNEKRSYPPKCETCYYFPLCEGFYFVHLERFGEDEAIPVPCPTISPWQPSEECVEMPGKGYLVFKENNVIFSEKEAAGIIILTEDVFTTVCLTPDGIRLLQKINPAETVGENINSVPLGEKELRFLASLVKKGALRLSSMSRPFKWVPHTSMFNRDFYSSKREVEKLEQKIQEGLEYKLYPFDEIYPAIRVT
jgi:MoaA/NifB/PqqE/SkfB family radical SAM enzyme